MAVFVISKPFAFSAQAALKAREGSAARMIPKFDIVLNLFDYHRTGYWGCLCSVHSRILIAETAGLSTASFMNTVDGPELMWNSATD